MQKSTKIGGRILVAEWNRPDPDFRIPRKVSNRFIFLKSAPIRVLRVRGSGPVHTVSSTEGTAVSVFSNAIAVGSPLAVTDRQFLNRFGLVWNLVTVAMIFAFFFMMISLMKESTPDAFDLVILIFSFCAGVLFALGAVRSYRMLRLPPDWPILFNRRTREVTYFKVNMPTLFGLAKAVPTEIVTRSWDEARLRTYRRTLFFGKTFRIVHEMALLWEDPTAPGVLKDVVLLGNQDILDDSANLRLWEHIRRYMEESGPALNPGESLRRSTNGNPPLQFPIDIQQAAGGPPLSPSEIAALASRAEGAEGVAC